VDFPVTIDLDRDDGGAPCRAAQGILLPQPSRSAKSKSTFSLETRIRVFDGSRKFGSSFWTISVQPFDPTSFRMSSGLSNQASPIPS
jgi:hypothetical protein